MSEGAGLRALACSLTWRGMQNFVHIHPKHFKEFFMGNIAGTHCKVHFKVRKGHWIQRIVVTNVFNTADINPEFLPDL